MSANEPKLKPAPSPSVAVEKRRPNPPLGERGFVFDLDGAIRFATGLVESGMVPKGISKPGAVVGLIEAGRELGLQPMYALANLTFTNGRLGIMGDAAKALIRGRGALEPGTDFEEIYSGAEGTPSWSCTVTAHRKGQPKPFSASFSIQDATTAKLVRIWTDGKIQSRTRDGWSDDGPWATYTKRMLMYRALGFLCRDRFSDILGGAVLTEELRDYPKQQEEVTDAPPAGPDPLLASAAPAPPDAVEAEVIHDQPAAQSSTPPTSDGDGIQISLNEQQQIAAVEKLEGAIVSAESLAQLDKTWRDADSLLQDINPAIHKRLTKLYQQNAQNFKR